jgi:hypothetical protein
LDVFVVFVVMRVDGTVSADFFLGFVIKRFQKEGMLAMFVVDLTERRSVHFNG